MDLQSIARRESKKQVKLCACANRTQPVILFLVELSRPSVRSLVTSTSPLPYGPAPESSDVAKAWLEEHGDSLGHFINGGWVKPEGRKTYDTINPATGEKLASTIQGQYIIVWWELCNLGQMKVS